MFLTSSLGTVQGVGTGTLTVTLTGVRRAGSDDVVPPNPYTVDLSCFIDDCDTDAHFPGNRDLTDANMSFTGLVIDVTLDDFERCSLSRPDCQGITFDGFSFAMLAGDLAIVETSNIVSINYDLNNGTLNQESGTAEDSFFSQLIPFGAITLASSDKTAELQINFVNSVTGFKQRLELGALGTGFNNPEAFASREPGDCLGGLPPCSHDFGPGMIVSNSMGSLGDAFTTMQTTVKLTNPDGNFAGDFINPYVWGAPP
jgi:hypothetical protein